MRHKSTDEVGVVKSATGLRERYHHVRFKDGFGVPVHEDDLEPVDGTAPRFKRGDRVRFKHDESGHVLAHERSDGCRRYRVQLDDGEVVTHVSESDLEPKPKYVPAVGEKVRLLEPKGAGCDVSHLATGAVHEVYAVDGDTVYLDGNLTEWNWRLDSVEPAEAVLRVPVWRGGRRRNDSDTPLVTAELWSDDRHLRDFSTPLPLRWRGLTLQTEYNGWNAVMFSHGKPSPSDTLEWRVSKNWDWPLPEGCYWAEEWTPKSGDRVMLKRSEGCLQKDVLAGHVGTVREVKSGGDLLSVEWDGSSVEGTCLADVEPVSERWTPKDDDRVRGLGNWAGMVGTVKYLRPQDDGYVVHWDPPHTTKDGVSCVTTDFTGSFRRGYVEPIPPTHAESSEPFRVRAERTEKMPWGLMLGDECVLNQPVHHELRQAKDGYLEYYKHDAFWSQSTTMHYNKLNREDLHWRLPMDAPGFVGPDGTLDLPVKRVSEEEWNEVASGNSSNVDPEHQKTMLVVKGKRDTYWSVTMQLRVKDNEIQWYKQDNNAWYFLRRYADGDERQMEWWVKG